MRSDGRDAAPGRARALDFERIEIYRPAKSPGFVAWATCFDYGDGRVGLSFRETREAPDPGYVPPRIELCEAVGAPVSYGSIECGSATRLSERVYMVSDDGGRSFRETGRCPLDEGSFCNVGFPDGRILGLDVPRLNEEGTGWREHIAVRESRDGGRTWTQRARLLEGTAPYLWRVRRLRDGTIVVLASLYGTPWGLGRPRATRNTMLPGETYLNKIQTFFLASADGGETWDGPHYILPGTGAHEYDVVEPDDGTLLFLAGDVQSTPVARQAVRRSEGRWINGTLYGIRRGAPPDPASAPAGGFVPEAVVRLDGGLIVGSRRNKPYSCSNDLGENWTEIDGLPPSLYQPCMMRLADGTVLNFGHRGGDSPFGEEDMVIGVDRFRVDDRLPKPTVLTLTRLLSPDGSRYANAFEARLLSDGRPVAGAEVRVRYRPVWRADGTYDNAPLGDADRAKPAVTDADGIARVAIPELDGVPDIHFYYNVDAAFRPDAASGLLPCDGPTMCVAALTPARRNRFPYDAYFAEGVLHLSPDLVRRHPGLPAHLAPLAGRPEAEVPEGALPDGEAQALVAAGALRRGADGALRWLASVHAPQPLAEVQGMDDGDWYV